MIFSQLRPPVPKLHRHHLLRPPPPRQEHPLCRRGEPKAQLHQVNAVLDAVLLGVQQLQTLQAQQLTNPKKADAPETVKAGITAFPKLAPPDPAGGSLEFPGLDAAHCGLDE